MISSWIATTSVADLDCHGSEKYEPIAPFGAIEFMTGIRTALAASIAARGWAALAGLLAVPVYANLLGLEAYGVVGFFASVQVVITFLDFGLPATLTRELAGRNSAEKPDVFTRDLILTFEVAYIGVTILVGVVAAVVVMLLAEHWLYDYKKAEGIFFESLVLASLALACQWPNNLYSAGLIGLHKQAKLAVSSSIMVTLKVAMTLGALWLRPTLETFFLIQIATGLMQSIVTRWQLMHFFNFSNLRPVLRWPALKANRGFIGGMTAIAGTAIAVTQIDRAILSHMLPLTDFAVYVIAGTIATGIHVLINPMCTVVSPRLTNLMMCGDKKEAFALLYRSSQILAVMVVPLVTTICTFPAQALWVWTGSSELASQASLLLVWLCLGSLLNGLIEIPVLLLIAQGRVKIVLLINLLAIMLHVPFTWWAVTRFGSLGAAMAWAFINAGFVVFIPCVLRYVFSEMNLWRWYFSAVLIPFLISGLILFVIDSIHYAVESRVVTLMQLFIYWLLITIVVAIAMPSTRLSVYGFWKRYRKDYLIN